MSDISAFLATCCIFGSGRTTARDLRGAFAKWQTEHGRILGAQNKQWGKALAARGCTTERKTHQGRRGVVFYTGVQLEQAYRPKPKPTMGTLEALRSMARQTRLQLEQATTEQERRDLKNTADILAFTIRDTENLARLFPIWEKETAAAMAALTESGHV